MIPVVLTAFRSTCAAAAVAVIAGIAGAALAFGAAPIAAQQLLTDGDFDGTLGTWFANGGTLTLGTIDATGCAPDSESARAVNSESEASAIVLDVHACVAPVVAGESYSFGGLIRFVTGQVATGNAHFFVRWSPETNCTGLSSSDYSFPIVTSALAGSWVESRVAAVAPAGTQSVDLLFRLEKDGSGGTLATRFDRVYFARGDLIFTDDFEIGRTCRWSPDSP